MSADASASRTPLYLTFALMLFGFGSISSARVALSLYALDLGASASCHAFRATGEHEVAESLAKWI